MTFKINDVFYIVTRYFILQSLPNFDYTKREWSELQKRLYKESFNNEIIGLNILPNGIVFQEHFLLDKNLNMNNEFILWNKNLETLLKFNHHTGQIYK
jgi:hypothetical protein